MECAVFMSAIILMVFLNMAYHVEEMRAKLNEKLK